MACSPGDLIIGVVAALAMLAVLAVVVTSAAITGRFMVTKKVRLDVADREREAVTEKSSSNVVTTIMLFGIATIGVAVIILILVGG